MQDYQRQVQKLIEEKKLNSDATTRLLDMVSEVGELSKEVLKSTSYGKIEFEVSDTWYEELGDVFFSLICLANETDADLDECLSMALDKYNRRFDKKGQISSDV